MSSKLPTSTLGKVWDLSDIDRDGFLDRYEFTVAMHLVFRALQVRYEAGSTKGGRRGCGVGGLQYPVLV